jgi:hypothetical protein
VTGFLSDTSKYTLTMAWGVVTWTLISIACILLVAWIFRVHDTRMQENRKRMQENRKRMLVARLQEYHKEVNKNGFGAQKMQTDPRMGIPVMGGRPGGGRYDKARRSIVYQEEDF